MRVIQQNTATAAAREIHLILVDDADGKTPITAWTFAAGDLRVKKQGGSWANALGSNPTHTEDGVWVYTLTQAEVDTLGEGLVKVDKATFRMHIRTFEVVAYDPRAATNLGLTNLDATISSRASSTQATNIQTDVDDIQARLPATLNAGNIRASVESMVAGTITAAAIATDAIDADAIAASAVTEIQSGLATSAALATVQADTDDIQTRLPATLNAGNIRASVEVMQANVMTAAAAAADLSTEIATQVDTTLTASHGAGAWGGATAAAVADAVLEELIADHQSVAGSLAEAVMLIRGLVQNNFVLDNTVHNANGLMTAGRLRIFGSAAAATAATAGGTGQGEIASFALSATGTGANVTLYKSVRTL